MSSSKQRMLSRIAVVWRRYRSGYSFAVQTRSSICIGGDREFASSAFPDIPLPESVRETVKTSLLEHASRNDSRLWKQNGSHPHQNGVKSPINGYNHNNTDTNDGSSVDDSIGTLHDPLTDLYIQQETRYWPHLPSTVEVADPIALARDEITQLASSIRQDLIGTDHPVLNKAASYFFESSVDGGKKVRPMLVLLLSRALADSVSSCTATTAPPIRKTSASLFTDPLSWQRPDLPQAQRRLAEISELIHTASLFHDDVMDGADTRRSMPAVHTVFGNKMAILAGDYLLARASIYLARLRNVEVVETMSTIIEHLVRGEVMQLRGNVAGDSERLTYYLRKNFYKTGSLMANSCKSAALLGSYPEELVNASYRFGKHVGMAFQLVDDVLDFEGSLSQLGKPALSDIQAGLATAPVLFAAEEYPELEALIDRKFKQEGDVDQAVELVFDSAGIARTKHLARLHAEKSMDAILELNPSEYRDALVQLAYKVVARTK